MVASQTQFHDQVEKECEAADAVLLVAPETDQILLNLCRWLAPWKSKFISPNAEFVAIASNKNLTCDLLERHGIPVS